MCIRDRIDIITGDIKDASKRFGASSFDVITTNPPYMIGNHGQSSDNQAKACLLYTSYYSFGYKNRSEEDLILGLFSDGVLCLDSALYRCV